MTDALLPLRCAYGAEVPGEPAAPPPAGTPGHAEWSLLAQMRDLLSRWPAAAPAADALEGTRLDALRATLPAPRAHGPSPTAVAAVEAYAAEATLGAVRRTYGESTGAAPGVPVPATEAALLGQSRDVLERAPRPAPSDAVLAAVLARAAEARRRPADPPVAEPSLAAVAAVYGLEASAAPDPVEAAVLGGMRDALVLTPRAVPSAEAVAAVLARAAEAVPSPAVAVPTAAPSGLTGAPARRPAPGRRAAAPPRAAEHRLGRWAGATALLGAAVVALLVGGPAVFNGLPGLGSDAAPVAETAAVVAVPTPAESLDPTSSADEAFDAPTQALSPDDFAGALAEADTPGAPAPRGPSATAPRAVPPAAPSAPVAAARAEPRPSAPAASTVRLAVAERALADVAVPPPPPPPPAARPAPPREATTWDASGDLRTISLRVSALRRTTGTADWERVPAEAFGAPRAPVTMSATPGVQAVRAGAAPTRARVLPDTTDSGN